MIKHPQAVLIRAFDQFELIKTLMNNFEDAASTVFVIFTAKIIKDMNCF